MAEHEPMVEVFIYETRQFLEQLEQLALASESEGSFAPDDVNEIFRAMHTIKGSAAMMMLEEISKLAHAVEDIFFYIRELHPKIVDVSAITDIVLTAVDFMNGEVDKLDAGEATDGSSAEMRERTHAFLRQFKIDNGDDPDVDLRKAKPQQTAAGAATPAAPPEPPKEKPQQYFIPAAKPEPEQVGGLHVYAATLHFEADCGMEEVRAFGVLNRMKDISPEFHSLPEKILEDPQAVDTIKDVGFRIWFQTDMNADAARAFLEETIFLDKLEFQELASTAECEYWPTPQQQAVIEASEAATPVVPPPPERKPRPAPKRAASGEHESQMISVRVDKLDRLMDLVGELVIAESMVTQNPDLAGLELANFSKAARQLHKLNEELQDGVMSLRMVPIGGTFKKMNRIVRDMTKNLGKKARLVLEGEETEVDKNITEHIGDPLMHIVRNSMDHGIELPEERKAAGKPEQGTITLAAQNEGGEVVITIRDDGGGMNREKIMEKAREKGLLTKPEDDYTDQEVFGFIFAPGFSTNDEVTEYSGRGVGMDVVVSNIRSLGGSVAVDSVEGQGTVTTIRIPLTLAIVDGMVLSVGGARYTLPIRSIRRSFRPAEVQVFLDAEGHEMCMDAGRCCPVLRLARLYGIEDAQDDLTQAILLLVEADGKPFLLAADELLGVQQIVVKPVPTYIRGMTKRTGITGCTLLGDGGISLIIDPEKTARLIYA